MMSTHPCVDAVMNKQNGLVIRPFRKAHQNRATDKVRRPTMDISFSRVLAVMQYYLQRFPG